MVVMTGRLRDVRLPGSVEWVHIGPSYTFAMAFRDAVVEDVRAIARVGVAAWQAAYAGLMPAEYLAGLDPAAAVPAFERGLRGNLLVLLLERDGDLIGFSAYGASRDPDAVTETGEVFAINLHPSWWRRGMGRELLGETQQRLRGQGSRRRHCGSCMGTRAPASFTKRLVGGSMASRSTTTRSPALRFTKSGIVGLSVMLVKPRVTSFAPQFLVDDLARSIADHEKLGFTFDEPWEGFYAIGRIDGLELHLKEAPKN